MKNVIQFKRGFINLTSIGNNNYQMAMSVVSELMQFGYVLDQKAIEALSSASREDIIQFHNEVIDYLKVATGSTRNFKPFWKGFPEQVMEMSEHDLWLHQIVHYLSEGSYDPSDWTRERKIAFEQPKYYTITKGDDDQYLKIFTDLVSVNQSLTPDDLEDVKFFVSSGAELRFPDSIPFKENLCTLAGMSLDVPVKTVTDVLRIAVHMSGGDISLPKVPDAEIRINSWRRVKSANPYREAFKFKKFTRAERKRLLGLLEKTNCDVREFALKDQRWIRLGEILHPGEYSDKFPKAYGLFNKIRNENVKTWYGEVDAAFKESFDAGIKKLSERPGEFIRRFDYLIRSNEGGRKNKVTSALLDVAPKTSNKVLFEVYSHFSKRENPVQNRSIMIKGARKRTQLPDLPALKSEDISNINSTIFNALKIKFSTMDSLGKVWIDEDLKKIPIPTNMRSMNSALRPVIRGQRIPIGNQNAKVVRAYVHWFDENGNRDIDLTATYIGMGKTEHVGWNGHHNSKIGVYSGDVRYRKGACAEYIDINVAEALKAGFKFVVMDARNYNGGSLAEIQDCVFGYMEREHPKANLTFKPDTLANSVRLQSSSSTTLVAVIDLESLEYIFLDIDANGIPVASANFNTIMDSIRPYTEMPKFSVYDLLHLHAESRGELVSTPEDAETTLKMDDFSQSYVEILKWMGI